MNPARTLTDIESAIHAYLEGIHTGTVELLKASMHPDCRMICTSGPGYLNIGMDVYFDMVAKRQSPAEVGEERRDEIVSITRLNEEIAFVNLKCLVLGKHCEDALTLIPHDGEWRIIAKVFAYQLSAPQQ